MANGRAFFPCRLHACIVSYKTITILIKERFSNERPIPNIQIWYIDGLVQERRNSIANAMELRLSCIDPSIWSKPKQCSVMWSIISKLITRVVRNNKNGFITNVVLKAIAITCRVYSCFHSSIIKIPVAC